MVFVCIMYNNDKERSNIIYEMCYWTKSHIESAIQSLNCGLFHLILLLIIFGLVFPCNYGKYFPSFFLGKLIGILVENRLWYTAREWPCETCSVRKLTSLNIYWEARSILFFIFTMHGYSKCHEQMIWLKGVFSCVEDQIKSWCVWNLTNSVLFVCLFFVLLFFLFFWINVSCRGEPRSCLLISCLLIRNKDVKCSPNVLLWKLAQNKQKSKQNLFWGSESCQLKNTEQETPQSNLYSVCIKRQKSYT